jgi:hypothetical protein
MRQRYATDTSARPMTTLPLETNNVDVERTRRPLAAWPPPGGSLECLEPPQKLSGACIRPYQYDKVHKIGLWRPNRTSPEQIANSYDVQTSAQALHNFYKSFRRRSPSPVAVGAK